MSLPKWRRRAIELALLKTEAVAKAANGEKSTCSAFDRDQPIEEVKRNIRIYLETWVIPELEKALKEKEF